MWTRLAVTVCLLAAWTGALPPRGPGGRIVGGEEAHISRAPSQVAVLLDDQFVCSGAVIGPKWALSAAQCLCRALAERYRVRAGSSHWCQGGTVYMSEEVHVRDCSSWPPKQHDIGLIKIQGTFSFGDDLKMAKLGTQDPEAGTAATVCGWGATSEEENSCTLRCVAVEVEDRCWCNQTYGGAITDRMVCASASASADCGGPCWGDTGAPLLAAGTLLGLAAQPWHCGEPGLPAVYTAVAPLRKWIRDTAGV